MNDSLPQGLKLNLGCGPVQPPGWVNVDGSNRAWLASRLGWLDRLLTGLRVFSPTEFGRQVTYLDLFKPLPYPEASVACIYAGELWEHFEYPDAGRLTAECARVLAPGGVLRVCVPDGLDYWRRYVQMVDTLLAQPPEAREVQPLRDYVHIFFETICTRKVRLGFMGHFHKWQFDEVQLVNLLRSHGLKDVGRRRLHDSRIPDVASVERSNYLIVEGVKP
jgi:predicted SAM-dependent methyltransferase